MIPLPSLPCSSRRDWAVLFGLGIGLWTLAGGLVPSLRGQQAAPPAPAAPPALAPVTPATPAANPAANPAAPANPSSAPAAATPAVTPAVTPAANTGTAGAADAAATVPPAAAAPAATPAGDAAVPTLEEEVSLLKRDPFDRITLDAANKNAQLEVFLLPFPGRKTPESPQGTKLKVRLLRDEKEYEVLWKNIARIDLFEEMLLAEAERLRDAGQFDDAFDYYYLLRTAYPKTTNLETSLQRYLYQDGFQLARTGRFAESLGVLEELYTRNPKYESQPPLMIAIGGLLDRIISVLIEKKDYLAAQKLLTRVARQYGAQRPPSVNRWAQQLAQMAAEKRDAAKQLIEERKFYEAIAASREMMNIWPNVSGAKELNDYLTQQFPQITVGVLQPALEYDSRQLDNWGARRTGRLIHRTLVEFLGAGPEGGQYELSVGSVRRSSDQRRLTFNLKQFTAGDSAALTGYDISRRLLDMADPNSPRYLAAWGGVMAGAQVRDVMQVDVTLRQPHVLPEALLRVPIVAVSAEEAAAGKGNGPFLVSQKTDTEIHFGAKGFEPGGRLAEVVERSFETTQQALAALRRGEIDVVDRVFPADAARLKAELPLGSELVVAPYALPTIHVLRVNIQNPFLAHRDFRRAILIAIDRQRILKEELLGNREIAGCEVISGPFARGNGERDPLAYAYDTRIEPRAYSPRLAKLLTVIAQNQVVERAQKSSDPVPELKPLKLGHPSFESARIACEAIVANLQLIGIAVELKPFPPGVTRDPENKVDLTYSEIAIWEPLVDARRLLGDDGLANIDSPYIRRSLRRLDEAQDWSQVRDRLLELHQTANDELPVLPLWQLVDSFVYHQRLRNIVSDTPLVWLYQNIDNWRLTSAAASP